VPPPLYSWTVENGGESAGMLWGAVRGAVMLVLLAAVPAPAHAADCWLLDADALARARARGECLDAFATSPKAPYVKPPTIEPPATSPPEVKPPPPARNVTPPKDRDGTRVATTRNAKRPPAAKPRRDTRVAGTDFAGNFRRDLNAVGDLLGDLFAGRPPARSTRGKGAPPPAPHHR